MSTLARLCHGLPSPVCLSLRSTHASIVFLPMNIAFVDMDMRNGSPSNHALKLPLVLVLIGALLPSGHAFGQSPPSQSPPEGPEPGDTRGPGEEWDPEEECEDRDDDGDCDPIYAALGTLFAESLPYVTDGARISYGRVPGGSAYGGRLEWTLYRLQGRRLMIGAGVWTAPAKMLQPGTDGRPFQPGVRDGTFSLSLGGSASLVDVGLPAGQSVRAVGEATALVGDPGGQLRLTIGPRYQVAVEQRTLEVDLVAGTNLGAEGFAPRVGLRIGWTWD